MALEILYYSLAALLVLATYLPYISSQYWIFRVCEFLRLQLLVLLLLLLVGGFFLSFSTPTYYWITQVMLISGVVNHAIKLVPYLPYKSWVGNKRPTSNNSVTLLSFNVLQFNTAYQKFIDLVQQMKPDIFLTVESNKDWEDAMRVLDADYPFQQKVALENTYGMHFYSKIKVESCKVNYFMADDIPSIEAVLRTHDGGTFRLFGIHPPPPSPTEEETSKERDGELVKVGKLADKSELPVLVVGDFNNVAWSRSTTLFRKLSGLVDPRKGRGLYSTYHAKYPFLRFPIDLLFHSPQIKMEKFQILGHIGSDHLPLFCTFYLAPQQQETLENDTSLNKEEKHEAREMIIEGKKENGNRNSD